MNTNNLHTQICIIGAGPAGLMASIFSAQAGTETIVIESNSAPARKLLLTGGGRCNLTHQATPAQFIRSLNNGGKFLRFCIHRFSPRNVQDFFAKCDLQTTTENDGCVFPLSNKACDVRETLLKKATWPTSSWSAFRRRPRRRRRYRSPRKTSPKKRWPSLPRRSSGRRA